MKPKVRWRRAVANWTLLMPVSLFAAAAFGQDALPPQPYIDRLKQSLEKDGVSTPNTADTEHPEDYLIQMRQQAEKRHQERLRQGNMPPEGESYSETLKRKLQKEEDSSEGYSERERAKLLDKDVREEASPADEQGAIARAQSGNSGLSLRRPGAIHYAAGIKLGASISRTITANSGAGLRSFSDVYGNSWVPDLQLFFEFQPFHSEWFGNLGFVVGGGFAVFKGKGAFPFALPIGSSSGTSLGNFETATGTNFQFLSLPAYVGVNYRFNLLRVLRPYVQLAPTIIGYREGRSDRSTALGGTSKGIQFSGGLNLLLDWISTSSSWDLYVSTGAKHYYLTLDYTKLSTVGSVINFNYSGLSAGMTFEF